MTERTSISTGQRKILERLKPGVRLMLDSRTGRYSFFEGDSVTAVDQRPIEAMLRNGLLEQDAVGHCYIRAGLDVAASLMTRKTHLLDERMQPVVCRYTKHPHARATRAVAADFAQLPANRKCPDCATRITNDDSGRTA